MNFWEITNLECFSSYKWFIIWTFNPYMRDIIELFKIFEDLYLLHIPGITIIWWCLSHSTSCIKMQAPRMMTKINLWPGFVLYTSKNTHRFITYLCICMHVFKTSYETWSCLYYEHSVWPRMHYMWWLCGSK